MSTTILTEDQVRDRIEKIILLGSAVRIPCLDMFADSIVEANRCNAEGWAITDETDRIRLHTGHIVVCTLCPPRLAPPYGGIWLALDQGRLDQSAEVRTLIRRTPEWKWSAPDDGETYRSIVSRNGYYRPPAHYGSFWRQLAPLHFASIGVSISKRRIDSRTSPRHQPAVLEYLRKVLKRDLPDPR